jgi:oligoendopeptidase F
MASALEQERRSDDPDLLAAHWDLGRLVDGEGEAGLSRLLDDAERRAMAFASAHTGRVAEFDGEDLIAAISELEEIRKLLCRARCYAKLTFAADTTDPAHGALLQGTEERSAMIEPRLVFFDLEWIGVEDARADALLEGVGEQAGFPAHYLRRIRASRPYRLSAAEERVLAETAVTRLSGWQRLYNESAAALRVELGGESLAVDTALGRFESPDRDVRRAAADAVAVGLADGIDVRAFCLNMVLQEKAVDDRLRGYPNWLTRRHLENEASDEEVHALLHAVQSRSDIPRRWYRLSSGNRDRRLLRFLADRRRDRGPLLRGTLDRRAGSSRQTRRRVLHRRGA